MQPSARLFVALDLPDVAKARALVTKLGDTATCYKIGLELLFGGGIEFAQGLKGAGKQIFLDMKLLDIPNTVEKAVANIAGLGVDYVTIHATDSKTMAAAVKGRGTSQLKLLGVTVLTSLDAGDLREQGITALAPADLVVHRARLAQAAGFDGVVASGLEAAVIRAAVGPGLLIVTPGIRLTEGPDGDQARVMTPERAIAAGASHLVVGRPISEAADPAAAARHFIDRIASAQ
jgi:orotidine-5'-phosphate decarboxylase